jgi:hypothetical protein
MSDIIRQQQPVPDGFAATLRQLRRDSDPRLSAVLAHAVRDGWTLAALAAALGITHQGVRNRVTKYAGTYVTADLPHIPLPPRRPTVHRPSPARLIVGGDLADRLRALYAEARTVTGGTPVDSPKRQASITLTEMIANLVDRGVTTYQIAQVLGVTTPAVVMRLARHGYRDLYPSLAGQTYRGIQSPGGAAKPLTGPDDPRHGRHRGYRLGCRCGECRAAAVAYERARRASRAGTRGGS